MAHGSISALWLPEFNFGHALGFFLESLGLATAFGEFFGYRFGLGFDHALVAAGQGIFVLCSIGTDYCGPQFCRLWIGGHYFFVGSHVWGFGGLAGQSKQGLVLAAKKEIEGDKSSFDSALMERS